MSPELRKLVTKARIASRVVRRDGARVVLGRSLAMGSERVLAGAEPFAIAIRPEDVLAASVPPAPAIGSADDERLVINWVTNPPAERSGGMTTAMRVVSLLEQRGHDCRIYPRYQGLQHDLEGDRRAVRDRRPPVRAEVHDVAGGMRPAHAIFATSWPTAYVVRSTPTPGARFYLVQDYEPMFYPAGSNAALAEETYRFGFHGLTAGPWLADKLEREHDMACDGFDLGVDLDVYRFENRAERPGIVFFARPDTPRRGFELGVLALELFALEHPEVEIHVIGQHLQARAVPFAFTDHGHLPVDQLAALYNRCRAGLVLSLTNLSLLPAELLATGCVPVMNDGENTRASCDSPLARYARPEPRALAAELGRVVDHHDHAALSAAAAASVGPKSWELVADQIEAGLRRGLKRAEESPAAAG
ncbi:MAG: rhamnosyltransferase WsaF family glycosyltransferase [Acidimicrobiales bacterium]